MILRVVFFIIISTFFSMSLLGQSQAQLEKKRKRIQKEITEAKTLLVKSKKEAEALLSELDDLNKIISIRSRLIRTIDEEAEVLSEAIAKNEKQINTLEKNLAALKKEYANMVVSSYKSKNKQSRLMFLLSSESFGQAYKRLQYIKQYANYRKQQGEQIKISAKELSVLTDSLRNKEDEKRLLIALHTKQKDSIDREKNSQVQLVGKVKAKERKYIAQIKKKQAEERKIDRQIDRLIAAAIAKSKKGTGKKASSVFHLTPEEKNLAGSFVANKGKLYWPVKKGLVVRKFGRQKHPTMPGITINPSGIYIATEKGAKARAVFKGTIMSIYLQPGRKKTVLIQHGNYITAYTNLDNVLLKKGDTINTGDDIGTIHTDAINGKTVLIFSIYKETVKLNPEPWIGKIT